MSDRADIIRVRLTSTLDRITGVTAVPVEPGEWATLPMLLAHRVTGIRPPMRVSQPPSWRLVVQFCPDRLAEAIIAPDRPPDGQEATLRDVLDMLEVMVALNVLHGDIIDDDVRQQRVEDDMLDDERFAEFFHYWSRRQLDLVAAVD